MIKTYLKIAFRNIRRNSTYSILNISGMAIGMACAILILLWVHDEWSFDRHFKNADNLYRILEKSTSDGHLYLEATTPPPLAAFLKEKYPEVIRSSRYKEFPMSVKCGEDYIFERIAFADDDFLKMFDIKLVKGDVNQSLNGPVNLLITEEMARKYFGNEDPIGKFLKTTGYTFTVSGVIKSLPPNSHLHFDFLGKYRLPDSQKDKWNVHSYCFSYIELSQGSNGKLVSDKIRDVVKSNVKGSDYYPEIFLQNFKDIHLNSSGKYTRDIQGHGDIIYVRILAIVAVFILIIACINFMNLATAQSSLRLKEIGMRKVIGSDRTKIIFQFLGESLLLVFMAHIIGMILVEILLPGFNNLTAKHLIINYRDPQVYIWLIFIMLICSILAGAYPALYLSSLRPLNILKGIINNKPGITGFRRAMVIFQFSLSVLLIICTLVVGSQLRYLQNKNLGLSLSQIGHFKIGDGVSSSSETLKADLTKIPDILNTTIVDPDVFDKDANPQPYNWEGNNTGGEFYFSTLGTDADFLKTFQLEMKEGRFYSDDFPGDTTALVINEKAAGILGFKDPIGKVLTSDEYKYRIIGVIKDFHFKTLKTKIEPLFLLKISDFSANCYIRMRTENISYTVDKIKKLYRSYNLTYPVEFKFLDDEYDMLYRTEQRIGRILLYYSILAIIISCIGLLGLSIFMTEIRTKEIGLRKVNGAKSFEILFLLSKEYLILVLISILIASPVAWFCLNKWLQSYAYRITLNPWIFVLVGLIVLVIALLTVGFQSYRAANKNPLDALRYE
jgi:putative ABC transport system permease protein